MRMEVPETRLLSINLIRKENMSRDMFSIMQQLVFVAESGNTRSYTLELTSSTGEKRGSLL